MKRPRIFVPLVKTSLSVPPTKPPEQLRLPFPPTLWQLTHPALAVDSMMGINADDIRPPRRVYLSTAGKSVEQIVREFAQLLDEVGMLKK